jgi:hypothetical protein
MNFQFENMQELQEFIAWAGYARGVTVRAEKSGEVAAVELTGALVDAAVAVVEFATEAATAGEPTAPHGEDKPKRTRRTKAEVEAERNAAAVAQDNTGAVSTAGEQEPIAVETPAQTAIREVTERARAAKAAKEAAAEGVFEQALEAAITTKEEPATGDSLPLPDYLAFRVPQLAEVSQVDHLKAGRDFIGKHGVQKYNESFSLAGLSNNVMAYSQADCATHMAALEWLGSSLAV